VGVEFDVSDDGVLKSRLELE
jgi:hypothetical protein